MICQCDHNLFLLLPIFKPLFIHGSFTKRKSIPWSGDWTDKFASLTFRLPLQVYEKSLNVRSVFYLFWSFWFYLMIIISTQTCCWIVEVQIMSSEVQIHQTLRLCWQRAPEVHLSSGVFVHLVGQNKWLDDITLGFRKLWGVFKQRVFKLTYMSSLSVIGRTHQSVVVHFSVVLSHVPKNKRGDSNDHHQHPHAYDHPPHNLPAGHPGHSSWKHQNHQPVHTHQCDEKDGCVHVGVAQVEQAFAHDVAKVPRLPGEVDDEEDGEDHEKAIGKCQVEDEDGGDWASSDACQDAPDNEEVARDAQEEDQAEDEGAQGCGEVIAHNTAILWLYGCGIDRQMWGGGTDVCHA